MEQVNSILHRFNYSIYFNLLTLEALRYANVFSTWNCVMLPQLNVGEAYLALEVKTYLLDPRSISP